MTSFKKLQSYQSSGNEDKIENPYTKKKTVTDEDNNIDTTKSVLHASNGILLARINILEREIKDLRMDIITLLQYLSGEQLRKYENIEAKGLYSEFRSASSHLINRIIDKIDNKTGESKI